MLHKLFLAAVSLAMVTAFTYLFPVKSHAILTTANDANFGAGQDGFNLTLDTATGLEWLDVTLSGNRTFNDLTGVDGSNEFNIGGDFAGYRYATETEIIQLFDNAGVRNLLIGATGKEELPSSFNSAVSSFLDLTGRFAPRRESQHNASLYIDTDGNTFVGRALVREFFGTRAGLPYESVILPNGWEPDNVADFNGSWLVRDNTAPIPEPSTMLLLASGLAGLGFFRRRKKAA